MNEDELKDLEKEVRKLKRIAGEWASQLHDLVEGRLPALSGVEEEGEGEPPVAYHPRGWLRIAERRLNLGSGALKPEAEFHATVQTPDGPVTVHPASLDTVDPPFAEAEATGGRFVAITEARGCSPVELELLRRAYTVILG